MKNIGKDLRGTGNSRKKNKEMREEH